MHDALRTLNDVKPVEPPKLSPQEALDGSPALVQDAAGFISIRFQCGPLEANGINGTSIENVIDMLIRRLEGFQAGPFKCRENALAITKLEEAAHWLEHRTLKRKAQGVEGRNLPHGA
jgi:hypothetical protein